jgi:hypothetical protein
MPLPLMAIGLGISAATQIGKFLSGKKQDKLANKINPQWNQYQTSQYAKNRLGLAGNLYNARMAGAGSLEKNIMSTQGNSIDFIKRNSTDASQGLALAAGAAGQTNQSLSNLQTQESQNKYAMLGNLNDAYAQMINEGDKVNADQKMKYQMDVQEKNALRGAAKENMYGAGNDLASMFMLASQFGGAGGAGKSTMGRTPSFGQYGMTPTRTSGLNFGGASPASSLRGRPFNPNFNRI